MSDFSSPSTLAIRALTSDNAACALSFITSPVARQDKASAAGRARGFDEEDLAADRCPGQSSRDARNIAAQRDLRLEFSWAEDVRHVVDADYNALHAAFSDAHGGVAEDAADFASSWRTPASRV